MISQHQRDNNEGQRRDDGEPPKTSQTTARHGHMGIEDQTAPKDAVCSGWWVTRGGPWATFPPETVDSAVGVLGAVP